MTTVSLSKAVSPVPVRHPDGSINFDAYRAIAMVERQKASRRFWIWVVMVLKPGEGRPMVRGYAARLG
jgi:hypothetical protein